MILAGQAGIGKTTVSMMLKGEGGYFYDCTLKKNRGVDGIAELLTGASSVSLWEEDFGLKRIIMDEFDALTHDAQQMMKPSLERFADNTVFICTTNHLHKIIDPIKSRCSVIYFGYDPSKGDTRDSFTDQMIQIAKRILVNEGVEFNPDDPEISENLDYVMRECFPEGANDTGELRSPDIRMFIGMLQDRCATGEYIAF